MVHVLYSPSLDAFLLKTTPVSRSLSIRPARRRPNVAADLEEWADFLDALFYERPSHAFYPLTSEQFETVH